MITSKSGYFTISIGLIIRIVVVDILGGLGKLNDQARRQQPLIQHIDERLFLGRRFTPWRPDEPSQYSQASSA